MGPDGQQRVRPGPEYHAETNFTIQGKGGSESGRVEISVDAWTPSWLRCTHFGMVIRLGTDTAPRSGS